MFFRLLEGMRAEGRRGAGVRKRWGSPSECGLSQPKQPDGHTPKEEATEAAELIGIESWPNWN